MAKVVLKFNQSSEKGFNLDDGDIVSLNSLAQATPDASGINYGSIANTGSIELIDYNGNIAGMIESGELPDSDVGVDIFFNGNKIQSHVTTDSSYDENSKTLNINLSNIIKDLSVRKFSGYNYPNKTKTAYDLLYCVMNEFYGRTLDEESEFKPMLSDTIFYNGISLDDTIYNYLKYIVIKYPVIEPNQTFEAVINHICTLAQIQLFVDNSGRFKFVSLRPVAKIDKLIHIPLSSVASDIKKDIFVKNKYNEVEINETKVNDTTEANELCYTWASKEHVLGTDFKQIEEPDVKSDYYHDVGLGTEPTDVYRYSNITLTYYEVEISFDKNSNNNLTEIKDVYDGVNYNGEPYIRYSVDYLHETGTMKFVYNESTNYASMFIPNYTKSETGSGPIATYGEFKIFYPNNPYGSLTSYGTDSTNLKTVEVIYTDKYTAKIRVLVGYTKGVAVVGRYINTGGHFFFGNSDWAIAERYTPLEVNINFYGVKRKITFEEISSKSASLEEKKIAVNIPSNMLLQTTTLRNSKKIADVIKENILLDYTNGVRTAKVTVVPVDYYDSNGDKVINGESGELIKIGDIVEVEGQKNKNNELLKWRVTGSNFKYDGEPLQELELMELILFRDSRLIYYPTVTGLAYLVRASNTDISGKIVLGGQYDDGQNGLMDVVSIEQDGFAGCKNITEVVINKPINTPFTGAFAGSGVTKITFKTAPYGGTGDSVCDSCYNLTHAYLLGDLYGIGYNAFYDCTALKEVYIAKSVQHISQNAFYNCTSLTDVYYEGSEEDWENMSFKSVTGNDLLYNANFHFNYPVQ